MTTPTNDELRKEIDALLPTGARRKDYAHRSWGHSVDICDTHGVHSYRDFEAATANEALTAALSSLKRRPLKVGANS